MLENVATRQKNLQNVKIINMERHTIYAHLNPGEKWVNCGTVIVQDQLIQNVGILNELLIVLRTII